MKSHQCTDKLKAPCHWCVRKSIRLFWWIPCSLSNTFLETETVWPRAIVLCGEGAKFLNIFHRVFTDSMTLGTNELICNFLWAVTNLIFMTAIFWKKFRFNSIFRGRIGVIDVPFEQNRLVNTAEKQIWRDGASNGANKYGAFSVLVASTLEKSQHHICERMFDVLRILYPSLLYNTCPPKVRSETTFVGIVVLMDGQRKSL